jgi:hypothetical protein
MDSNARGKLMLASFLTLVASGVGFACRAAAGGVWEREFGIGGGDFGAIMGAGFLGFGVTIFLGGALVEKLGYKLLLVVAFVGHLVSAGMLFAANPMFAGWQASDPATATANVVQLLYWSTFIYSICQGLYEAVINPMIAQLYPDNQTHYLNILHAGYDCWWYLCCVFPWKRCLDYFVALDDLPVKLFGRRNRLWRDRPASEVSGHCYGSGWWRLCKNLLLLRLNSVPHSGRDARTDWLHGTRRRLVDGQADGEPAAERDYGTGLHVGADVRSAIFRRANRSSNQSDRIAFR